MCPQVTANRVSYCEENADHPEQFHLACKDQKCNHRVHGNNKHLVHISAYQIQAHDPVEYRHNNEADTELYKPTPEANPYHQQVAPQQLLLGGLVFIRLSLFTLVKVHDQHDGNHDQRQDPVEPHTFQLCT